MITIITSISLLIGILGTVGFFIMLGIIDKTIDNLEQIDENTIPSSCPFKKITTQEQLEKPMICPYCKKTTS